MQAVLSCLIVRHSLQSELNIAEGVICDKTCNEFSLPAKKRSEPLSSEDMERRNA